MVNYPTLEKSEKEPEYKVNPPLKISSVGTEIKKNSSQMPDGSALLTDTGSSSSLKNQGINYIIHAVPRHRNSCASDEEFIEIAVKAAQNSIILADREGIEKLAFCLIGGERYRGSCDPEKLAKGLVNGVLNQLEKCQNLKRISFIDWGDSSHSYFLKAYEEIAIDLISDAVVRDDNNFVRLKSNPEKLLGWNKGDLCDKTIHRASAIVNSENAGMGWGGGISGAIQSALGTEASSVDQQRKDLMKEFNKLINQPEEDNSAKITCQVRYESQGKNIFDNSSVFMFASQDRKYEIAIVTEHPIFSFLNIPLKLNKEYKLTWKKVDENKSTFLKEDYIEIEEIKGEGTPNQNDDKDNKDNQDSDESQKSNHDNGSNDNDSDSGKDKNNQNSDEGQNPSNGNSSNDNNSDKKKNKTPPTLNIPNPVKEYFRENNVKSIELDGENWIITYKGKNEKKSLQKSDVPKLKGLEDYLKSQGKKILTDEELKSDSKVNTANNDNKTKYWPWVLGIGGILVIGIVAWAVLKNRKESK